MLGKVSPFRITESCIKVRKSITTDYVTGASRFIGSHGSGSGKNEPRNSPLSPVQTEATVLANNFQHCWLLYVASVCMQLYKVTYLAKRSVKLDHIDILLLQKRGWTNYRDYNYIN